MLLYDNAFSPFARKVRLVLGIKGLTAEFVDGLNRSNRKSLRKVNGRIEVPVLVDGDTVVVNSSDIVAYLDHKYPSKPVLPDSPELRGRARKWERVSDTLVDAIMADISYWKWTTRIDDMPDGMLAAARKDLDVVYAQLDNELSNSHYICGELSIADIALFTQLGGAAALDVPFSSDQHPHLTAWLSRLRKNKLFLASMKRARDYLSNIDANNLERDKIFWRGERIEWVLASGFENWFVEEIKAERTTWPPQRLQ